MKVLLLLVAVSAVALSSLVRPAAAQSCSFSANGHSYDFSSLTSGSANIAYEDQTKTYSYSLNVCGVVVTGPNLGFCSGEDAMMCQVYNADTSKTFSLGLWKAGADPVWSATSTGASMLLKNGDVCDINTQQVTRQLQINFNCKPGASKPVITGITNVGTPEECKSTVELDTEVACNGGNAPGQNGGLSGGWVFVIILLVVTPVYCVGGCIYNKKQRGLEGRDMIPHREFWQSIPGLVKDGCKFTVQKIKGMTGGGYQEV